MNVFKIIRKRSKYLSFILNNWLIKKKKWRNVFVKMHHWMIGCNRYILEQLIN